MDFNNNSFNIKFQFDWCRHAESASNLAQGSILDKFQNYELDENNEPPHFTYIKADIDTILEKENVKYDEVNHTDTTYQISSIMSSIKSPYLYHPNLSFIGMQQAIRLGMLYNRKYNDEYNLICASQSLRTIMTAMLSNRGSHKHIYVVPHITEYVNIAGPFDFQNNVVPVDKLKRYIKFIKDWLERSFLTYFDDYELHTFLYHIKCDILPNIPNNILDTFEYVHNNIKYPLHEILDFILEAKYKIKTNYNYDSDCNDLNNDNDDITYCEDRINKIITVSNFICFELTPYIDIRVRSFFEHFLNVDSIKKFIRGPPVNFSLVMNETDKTNGIDMFYHSVIHLFIKHNLLQNIFNYDQSYHISNDIFDENYDNPNDKTVRILCYSHGLLINNYFNDLINNKKAKIIGNPKDGKTMFNTEIYRHTFDYNYNSVDNIVILYNHSAQFSLYKPIPIRKYVGDFYKYNIDVCKSESVKGIINYPMTDANSERRMIPYLSSLLSFFYQTKSYCTPDVQFILPDIYKNDFSLVNIQYKIPSKEDFKDYYPPNGLPNILI